MINKKKRLLLRLAILAAAVGCIGVGLAQGEQILVLQKAVKLCLECIGIG